MNFDLIRILNSHACSSDVRLMERVYSEEKFISRKRKIQNLNINGENANETFAEKIGKTESSAQHKLKWKKKRSEKCSPVEHDAIPIHDSN